MKFIYIFLILLYPIYNILALDVNLKGIIKDQSNNPIQGAKIFLSDTEGYSRSYSDGTFEFQHIRPGNYTLTAIAPNFQPQTLKIEVKEVDQTFQITLKPTLIESQGINVTGKSNIADFLSSPQPITVIEGRQLQRQRGQNIMSTLDNTPGVSNLTTGAGTSKPVIRGLTGQRVLVMTDGVRQEEQQFGDDHTVDLDTFDVDRIEVVRGPASVLYGSDALGGVMNIIRSKAPTSKDGAALLGGNISTNSFSNNKQDAVSVALNGYNKNLNLGYRIHTDERKASRITTPKGTLPNTGLKENNVSGSIGMDGTWGNFYVDSFQRFATQDLYNNPVESPGEKPYQQVTHQKTHAHAFFILPLVNFEFDAGYQRNNRREIPHKNKYVPIQKDLLDPDIDEFSKSYQIYQVNKNAVKQGLNLFLDTTTLDAKVHHKEWQGLKGMVGVQTMSQRNVTIGTEPLIPGNQVSNVGFFLFEQWKLNDFTFTGGVRRDKRSMDSKDLPELGVIQQTRNFEASTGTLGVLWNFAKSFSLALNSGRGFRAPTAFELFANGVHEGTGKFENGKNTLRPETSLNYDTTLRYATDKIQMELSVFRNSINNYIYSVSTGTIDSDSGLGIYKYRQDKALLEGGEFSIQAQLTKWMVIIGGIDILQGTISKKVEPLTLLQSDPDLYSIQSDLNSKYLPRMTPNRSRLGFRFTTKDIFGLKNPYFLLNGNFIQGQYKVDKLETPTRGYNLYDLGLGAEIPAISNGTDYATFDFSVQNIFNTSYVSNLSRYRDYALNPGINMTFKVNIPFTLISN